MTQRPLPIPSWAPAAAAAAIVVWAGSIWWMVASLPAGSDTGPMERGLSLLSIQVESADAEIAELTEQVSALRDERQSLVARLDQIEVARARDAAARADASEAAEESAPVALDPADHPLFTDGADRYNCRDFSSDEEAQQALEVNGPGDPNRIDMNGNGRACEDFKYANPTAATSESTPTSTAPVSRDAQGIEAR